MGLSLLNNSEQNKQIKDIDPHQLALKQLIHDIKSPISTLNLCVSHLNDFFKNQQEHEDKKELIDIINLSLERIENLIQSTEALNKNSKRLSTLSQKVTHLIKEYQFKTNVEFTLDNYIHDLDIETNIHADDLTNIIHNLYNNALNAQSNAIHTLIYFKNNSLLIQISDNGLGIQSNVLTQIGKVGASFCKSRKGQGLGLSHAKEKIMSWNGKVVIETLENRGTKISIQIPIK